MPVFGADPDKEEREFPEYRPSLNLYGAPGRLVSAFSYAPQRKMSQSIGDKEKLILARFFSQSLQQGFSEDSLRKKIDMFWQTWGSETEAPVYVFVSGEMQDTLNEVVTIERPSDPVLAWLFDGMPDRPAPFKVLSPKEVRKFLLISDGLDRRYPDVVADILRLDDDAGWTIERLKRLTGIIKWHEGEVDECPRPTESMMSILPQELLPSKRRHPSLLRKTHPTVHQAIAALKVGKNVHNADRVEERSLVA